MCSPCRPSLVRKQLGELGKVSEEAERKEETAARYIHVPESLTSKCSFIHLKTHLNNVAGQSDNYKCKSWSIKTSIITVCSLPCVLWRPKQDASDGDPSICKNSYNNPAYYILEGVPNQSAAALSPELLPSPTSTNAQAAKAPPPTGGARSKPPCPSSGPHSRRPVGGLPVRAISEEGSSEDDGGTCVAGAQGGGVGGPVGSTLNRPPPDFPPPPLPKGALEMVPEAPFHKPRPLYPDLTEVRIPAAVPVAPMGEGFRRGGAGPGALDDQSCSVLQMAKTLSESEFPGQPPRAPSAPPPLRGPSMGLGLEACRTFPPRNPIPESIAEDLPEEVSSLSCVFYSDIYISSVVDLSTESWSFV